VLSGRGLCDELITRPEESYRLCCVVVCDLETSRMGAPYIYDISHLRVKQIWTFSAQFNKSPPNNKSHGNPVGVALIRTGRRTDWQTDMTQIIAALCRYGRAANQYCIPKKLRIEVVDLKTIWQTGNVRTTILRSRSPIHCCSATRQQ